MSKVWIGSGLLPNLITTSRIVIIPWIMQAIVSQQWGVAFVLCAYGAVSDVADGFFARRFGHVSKFGTYFDPLADKIFILSIFSTFVLTTHNNLLPKSYVLFLCVRESILVVGSLIISWVAYQRGTAPVLSPSIWGKITTAFQMVYFLSICIVRFMVLSDMNHAVLFENTLSSFFLPPLIILSVYSFGWYGFRAIQFMRFD